MPVNRAPSDAMNLEVEALFSRWTEEIAVLDEALGPPQASPLGPDQRVSDEWRAEMRLRMDRVFPLLSEMALVYLHRLDDAGRRRAQDLLGPQTWVVWHLQGVIGAYFERFLQSLAQPDLDVAFALIALSDERARSRDFSRTAHPFYLALRQRGLAVGPLFRAGLALATRHEDPEEGAYGFFRGYADAGDG